MIYGNIEGVKKNFLKQLEELYEIKLPKYLILDEKILDTIVNISNSLEREVSVAIDRKGNIISVAIGDSTSVEMPMVDIKEKKLSGVRIIHTHPNGNSKLSALDNSALIKLKLDCVVAIGVMEGNIIDVSMGFCDIYDNNLTYENTKPMNIEEMMSLNFLDKVHHIEQIISQNFIEEEQGEKAILVGADTEESLDELEELTKACDIPVLFKVFQNRNKIDAAYFIGSGKVEEIASLCQAYRADIIIFDDELSGSQVRNLEEATGVKVIDRTTLILEIFSRRAKTREARIQVELAQLKYRLNRLSGLGAVLSRTGGGIGTRGPGEKKLETDRRHIKERIYDLSSELDKIKRTRETQRERRTKQNIPQVSLVGYTNAGKSTLRNKVCEVAVSRDLMQKDKVFEADMLFATLDTTTRAVTLPDNRNITLTDTVGFVRKLPHELVEAFKSTLEEVIYSDILVHVVDSSSPNVHEQIQAVEEVLSELGAKDKYTLLVFNKIDKIDEETLKRLNAIYESSNIVNISAKLGENLDELLMTISKALPNKVRIIEVLIPYNEQQLVAFLHRNSNVLEEEYRDMGTFLKTEVDDEVYNKIENYIF
ncbi:GTPase HflX [Desnuesiella massiliensis]|uniref:GTPase HflX n=1 Tax=Desnuesiella massiliensis TaxID=1650662 RepID=UPI0006E2F4F3|nr:GTPase HflX [Desnuesiella massiliensis]